MEMPNYEDLFKQIKINFWLIGIPYGDIKIYWRYYIFYLSMLLMIVEETGFIVSKLHSVNMLEITQLAPCTCIGLLSVLKITPITLKRQKIFELSKNLSRLYRTIKIESETGPLIRSQVKTLQTLARYFFILNAMLILVYNFSSPVIILYFYFTSGKAPYVLPYQVLLPFEINSWPTWSIVYAHSAACGFICTLYFTTIDVLYCVLTTHICANFVTISNQLREINKINSGMLKEIIKKHQYILKLSEDLEDIFTGPNLFNVLVGSIMICALGFNLAMGELKQIPGCILFLASVLLQILMMSIFGENIITESTKVGEAAYTCKWYEMDKKTKKVILTVMIRSKKPAKLTAYKFSVISYSSFCTILSTSWSYFTILRTVYTTPDSMQNLEAT